MILSEQQQQWLEDLVFKGEAFTVTPILNDSAKIKLVSMSGEKQLDVESKLGGNTGTALFVMHTYSLMSLSHCLKEYIAGKDTVKFGSQEEAFAFVKSRPAVVIDQMIAAQSAFESELKKITSPEVLTENFSKTPGTEEGSTSI